MQIHVEIQDASGAKLGELHQLVSASVTRSLDGAGSFDFSVPSTDEHAALLTNKRRAVVYLDYMGVNRRELGRGIIDNVSERDTGNGWTTSASGPDILTELKYTTTKIGREFANQTISDITSTLVALATGWSAGVESGVAADLLSTRFDGETVLRALQIVAENQGLHLRLGTAGKVLEVGAFGTTGDVTLMNAGQFIDVASYGNHAIAFIESISIKRTSDALATRLYPLGAGTNADAALTLEDSTRDTPYPIQSETTNGRTQYYIENEGASTEFGVIEKVGTFKTIAPLENSVTSIGYAANALYDAAAAWLERYSVTQEVINVTVTKLTQTVRPGDKIRLMYKGRVPLASGDYVFRNYDADFWVMSVTETVDSQGVSVSMELSDIDRYEQNNASVVIGALEELRVSGMRVQPSFAALPFYFEEDIDSTHAINRVVPVIDDAVFQLNRAKLFVRTTPFRANARGAATVTSDATGHQHTWASVLATPDGGGGFTTQTFSFSDGSNIWYFNAASNFNPGTTTQVFALNENPEHTHTIPAADLDYGIYDDDPNYPTSLTISINGSTVVSGADSGGTGLNTSYDVTDYFLPPTAAALRQDHTVEIECTSNQGTVECMLVFWALFLPFKFT